MPWFLTSILSKETVENNPHYKNLEQRTFGFYNHYYDAYKAVHENYGNMCECLYDYLVMEYIEEGIHPLSHKEEWFIFDTKLNRWVSLEKCPLEFEGLTNFALG